MAARRLLRLSLHCLVLALAVLAAQPKAGRAQEAQERSVGDRSYLIYVPPGVARPAPLVLVFHGGGGQAEGMMRLTRMNEVADRGHFIVVYPEGVGRRGGRGTWNVGGAESVSSADDVGFVRAVLADVERSYPIDPHRVYAAGWSMGGIFAYRLACEMSDTFAAIAPVSATMVEPHCAPQSPVAVLHIHGTADENIPFNGGTGAMTGMGRNWPSPRIAIDFWSHVDGCAPSSSTRQDGPETSCQIRQGCKTTVEMCVVQNGGHAWPGMRPQRWQTSNNVYVTQSFPASERIWQFFSEHPKP